MQDTSSVGLLVRLTASVTFPLGINITAFPEDNDVGVTGSTEIAGHASGINGDLITWCVANGIETQVPVIPNTVDESLMDILFQANRVSKNRFPKKDIINMTVTNPVTAVSKTYKNGKMLNAPAGYQYGGDGRIKTKVYTFVFEDVV